MPVPPHILALREKIGNALILCPGVRGIVVNDRNQILLNKRSDTGKWYVIGGMLEPGEQPAAAIVREVKEETGLDVVVERLIGVYADPPVTYPNGDRCQYVITAFRCKPVGGELRIDGDESLDVKFFDVADLPVMKESVMRCIEHALSGKIEADFID